MPRTRVVLAAAASALCLLAPSLAQAKVHIAVDLDAQTIHVDSASGSYDWKVSSGKTGYDTPNGHFNVLWMDKDHHSDEYEQAYMPNAIFFAPGFALHGFGKSPWGHKASHGCVRLPMDKSAKLFDMVKAEGADITITGASTRVAPTVASIEKKKREQEASAGAAPDAAVQGYADQGPANQGYADQGYVGQGGYARQGYAARGDADQGYARQGYAQQGYPAQSYAQQGYASDDGYERPAQQAPTRNTSLFGSFY